MIDKTSPITWENQVIVDGNYFVFAKNPKERFYIEGIAFPVAPHDNGEDMKMKGWIAVLKQLRQSSAVINTVRLYQIYPRQDYSEFLQAAADMGFYVIVPLTSISGSGVLSREKQAPNCYRRRLYYYGRSVVQQFSKFPNVLGYVLGNEVMNSLESWEAAPCVLAYARDMKIKFPNATLMYTMQHDGIGAAVSPSEAVQLTLDYMSECPDASIDALGINIESWCSSTQTFDTNPDGSIGTYKDLYQHMNQSKIAIFFSELGCSTALFNRDNGLEKGYRDWKQVHTILGSEMIDRWSGFVAYAYDGPPFFRMTVGGPWDGFNILELSKDFENFVAELDALHVPISDSQINLKQRESEMTSSSLDYCLASTSRAALSECCDLDLVPINKMPSFYEHSETSNALQLTQAIAQNSALSVTYLFIWRCFTILCLYYGIKMLMPTETSSPEEPEYTIPSLEVDCDGEPPNDCTKNYNTFQC